MNDPLAQFDRPYELQNARILFEEYVDAVDLELPTPDELGSITSGQLVKVMFVITQADFEQYKAEADDDDIPGNLPLGEAIWVEVTSIKEGVGEREYRGVLAQAPTMHQTLVENSEVEFADRHIMEILPLSL